MKQLTTIGTVTAAITLTTYLAFRYILPGSFMDDSRPTIICFPYAMLSYELFKAAHLSQVIALFQFPAYGAILTAAWLHQRTLWTFVVLVLLHTMAIAIFIATLAGRFAE